MTINQCDGCRRGLPFHRVADPVTNALFNGAKLHMDPANPHDAMVCTADRYTDALQEETTPSPLQSLLRDAIELARESGFKNTARALQAHTDTLMALETAVKGCGKEFHDHTIFLYKCGGGVGTSTKEPPLCMACTDALWPAIYALLGQPTSTVAKLCSADCPSKCCACGKNPHDTVDPKSDRCIRCGNRPNPTLSEIRGAS